MKQAIDNLYETDEHLWLLENIKLLKESRFYELDVENLIEELESLGKRDKNRVASFLEQIIRHLLLLHYWEKEVDRNRAHWQAEIQSFQTQLRRYLTTSLQNYLSDELDSVYQNALGYVRKKTEGKVEFPETCPYILMDLLSKDF